MKYFFPSKLSKPLTRVGRDRFQLIFLYLSGTLFWKKLMSSDSNWYKIGFSTKRDLSSLTWIKEWFCSFIFLLLINDGKHANVVTTKDIIPSS